MKRAGFKSDKKKRAKQLKKMRERAAKKYQKKQQKQGRRRLNPFNAERRERLYEQQFGDKGREMSALPCIVTGSYPGEHYWPVDNAHVGSPDPDVRKRTRAAGADNRFIARLRRDVHRSFDNDTDARFEEKWQTSKLWVRQWAAEFDEFYRRSRREAGEQPPSQE